MSVWVHCEIVTIVYGASSSLVCLRTVTYSISFLPCITREWNSLSTDLKSAFFFFFCFDVSDGRCRIIVSIPDHCLPFYLHWKLKTKP